MMQWVDTYAAPLLALLWIAAAGGFFVHERLRLPVCDAHAAASLRAAWGWCVLGLLCALVLGWMAWNMAQGGSGACAGCVDWLALDGRVSAWVRAQGDAPWLPAVKLLTQLGHMGWMAALGVCMSVWLLRRRAWLQLGAWALGVAGVGLCVRIIKHGVGRERPEVRWVLEQGYSFPSGHSAGTLVCYGLMAWLWISMARSATRPVVALTLLVVAGVGLSRIVLGAHYASDVLAGWLLGLAWLAMVVGAADMARHVAMRRQSGATAPML